MDSSGAKEGEGPARSSPPPALPPVIGHRGVAAAAPENTLAGMRAARNLGARWVEFDVKLTGDRHPILFHDDRLERTTDGFGPVARATLAEIRRLSAGRWFHPDFAGERVPTLEEALALCVELGLGVNVEIKPCPGRAVETARIVVETLVRNWPEHAPTPLISSFAAEALAVASELAPAVPRGHLSHRLPHDWRAAMARHGCATLHLDHRRVSRRQLARLLATGVPVLLYTVNDGIRARGLLDQGAMAVFTDDVGEVVGALG